MRSLADLEATASSSRVLNLVTAWRRHRGSEPYQEAPLFSAPALNRSIVVKHRLRDAEVGLFGDGRRATTKVIIPISLSDLRLGARSFFVGQTGYEECLAEVASGGGADDDRVLRLLDRLPSLDPFLVRECLNKQGLKPARCYFDLSEADAARLLSYVREEVEPLIGMSFGGDEDDLAEKTARLASKILENASDISLEPLRRSLGLRKPDFEEGVFSWKGLIYYKWSLAEILPHARPTALQIAAVRPSGVAAPEEKAYILGARSRLARLVGQACEAVALTLRAYEEAYLGLTSNGQPQVFREFLLDAPRHFLALGTTLGRLQDLISFWAFRFPKNQRALITTAELVGLLLDFETSLGGDLETPAPPPLRSRVAELPISAAPVPRNLFTVER